MEHTTPWIILIGYITLLLVLDFFVLNKKGKTPSIKKALVETLFFVFNAFVFAILIYWFYSAEMVANVEEMSPISAVMKYMSGYFIELSLSVDNLFVIAVIFTSFKVPAQFQHKLLFLGIIGALVFRAILISVGLVLMHQIESMTLIFGAFLLFTAFKMLKKEAEHEEVKEPSKLHKFFRLSDRFDGGKFMTKVNGKRVFTALFGALITIELTDLLFALDSIPAIFGVTTDPFIVYSSNIFAILGLRSLYFFLANMLERFSLLKYSVFAILLFVGLKLMVMHYFDIPEWFSLLFIALSLGVGIYASILNVPKTKENEK